MATMTPFDLPVVRTVAELRARVRGWRAEGERVGHGADDGEVEGCHGRHLALRGAA